MPTGVYERTEEHRRSRLGRKHSIETRRKIGLSQIGRQISLETRKKLSDAKKGKPPNNAGKPRSENTRYLHSIAQRGEKGSNWRGGITPVHKVIRHSLEYKLWREAVFKRDNWTCVWCGVYGGNLEADHIKPFAYFPELRFAIDNGRTLCKPCHRTTFKKNHEFKKSQKSHVALGQAVA